MSPTDTLEAPAVVEDTAVAPVVTPPVHLSKAEKDGVVLTAADAAVKPTVTAEGNPGTSRAWSAQAEVD